MGSFPAKSRFYTVILACGTVFTFAAAAGRFDRPWSGPQVTVAVLLYALIILAEFFEISLPQTTKYSINVSVGAALALAAGLTLGPVHGGLVVMAAHLTESIYVRRYWLKSFVNLCNYGLSTVAGSAVYWLLADNAVTPVRNATNLIAVIVASAVFVLINSGGVVLVLAPVLGTSPLQ